MFLLGTCLKRARSNVLSRGGVSQVRLPRTLVSVNPTQRTSAPPAPVGPGEAQRRLNEQDEDEEGFLAPPEDPGQPGSPEDLMFLQQQGPGSMDGEEGFETTRSLVSARAFPEARGRRQKNQHPNASCRRASIF